MPICADTICPYWLSPETCSLCPHVPSIVSHASVSKLWYHTIRKAGTCIYSGVGWGGGSTENVALYGEVLSERPHICDPHQCEWKLCRSKAPTLTPARVADVGLASV